MKITIKHKIFSNGEKSLDFLINHIIEEFIYCNSCSTPCKIKLLNIDSNKIIYRCTKRGCKRRHSTFHSTLPQIKIFGLVWLFPPRGK